MQIIYGFPFLTVCQNFLIAGPINLRNIFAYPPATRKSIFSVFVCSKTRSLLRILYKWASEKELFRNDPLKKNDLARLQWMNLKAFHCLWSLTAFGKHLSYNFKVYLGLKIWKKTPQVALSKVWRKFLIISSANIIHGTSTAEFLSK